MYRTVLLVIAAGFLFACGRAKKNRDEGVFNYNEMSGVSSLDPAAANNFENILPVHQIFNGLLQMDDSLNPEPCVARSYSISADGRQYTFILRNDVYFHDNPCFKDGKGRKVVAADFVFSFERLFDSKVSGAGTLLDRIDRDDSSASKGFYALSDTVFTIRLREPFSAFPSVVTMKYFSVVPQEALRMYGADFRRNPVGTGPFCFKMWDEGTKLILLKNENYFERDGNNQRLPYLKAVTVSFIRDRETAFMELLNGKFDMLSGADAFNTNEVLDREGNLRDFYRKKFTLQKFDFLKTDYIGILVDESLPVVRNSPLRLKAIRQAVNRGFDRRKLVKYLRNNLGRPAESGFIPHGMKSFSEQEVKGYTYDPDTVRALLAAAGFPNGQGLPEITLHISDIYKEQVEFMQSQLAENKIRVQISIEKVAVLRQAVNNSEFLLFKKSWFADYPDEENFMSLFYSRNFSPRGVNFFHYKNEKFDKLFEEAQKTLDEKKRIALYRQMDRQLIEDAPFIPMYYDVAVRLVSKKVSGLGTNAMNLLNLTRVKKEAE
jgi:oligopeptide transport system substrate-binding protein